MFKRRQYIVSPVQSRLALWAILLGGAGILAIWWEVNGDLAMLQKLIANDLHQQTAAVYITSYSEIISRGILYKALFVMAIIWIAAVFTLHHIFGPLYRLKACLKALQDGDLSCRMHLRKGDFLKDVEDSFNRMAEAIEARQKEKDSK